MTMTQTPWGKPQSEATEHAGTQAPPSGAATPWGAARPATPWGGTGSESAGTAGAPVTVYRAHRVKAVSAETVQKMVDFANLLNGILSQAGNSYPVNFQDPTAIQGLVAAAALTNFGKNETLGIDTKYPFASGSPVPPEGCTTQQATVTYQGQQFCVPNYNWDPTAGAKRYLDDFVYSDALASALKGRDAQNFAEALLAVPVFAQAPNVSKGAIAAALAEALASTAAALGIENQWTNTQVTVVDKTLPTDPALRVKAAANVLTDAWLQATGKPLDAVSLFGLLTAGKAWSNFGQVNAPSFVETNNWFKLGGYDKKVGECTDGLTVFDADTSRCVFTFENPYEGALYSAKSVMMVPAVVEALKTGDLGRIAEAMLVAGYNYPAKLTQDNWAALFTTLRVVGEQLAKDANIINQLKTSDYMPKFSDGGSTKPPPQGEKPDGGKTDGGKTDGKAGEETEKGWSLGAKVGLGVAIVGGLGLLGWAMMGKKGTAVSYQSNPAHPRVGSQEWYAGMPWVFAQAKEAAERVHANEIQGEDIPDVDILVLDKSLQKAAEDAGFHTSKNKTGFILYVPNIEGEDVPMDLRDRARSLVNFLVGYGVRSEVRGLENDKVGNITKEIIEIIEDSEYSWNDKKMMLNEYKKLAKESLSKSELFELDQRLRSDARIFNAYTDILSSL